MTELDQLIAAAYASQGKQEDVNKVYVALLQARLFLPVQKEIEPGDEEPFHPLYAIVDDNYFMLAFDSLERLTSWAGEEFANISFVELTGRDVLVGMNESVFLMLNIGSKYFKEFSPDEVRHLKKIVAKVDQLKG